MTNEQDGKTDALDRELLCDLFKPKPANRDLIMGGYTDDKIQPILDRIAHFRQYVNDIAVKSASVGNSSPEDAKLSFQLEHKSNSPLIAWENCRFFIRKGDTDENGDPVWSCEIQTIGGHSVIATVWGASALEARRRAECCATALCQETPQ